MASIFKKGRLRKRGRSILRLLLKNELQFPFINKAIQILQSILPDFDLTPDQELIFVLRAYGKAITGQNLNIEEVFQNEDYSFDAFLDKGSSMALLDQFSRKLVAVTKFNDWLFENDFSIQIRANPKYYE